jgi:hypothetical protein
MDAIDRVCPKCRTVFTPQWKTGKMIPISVCGVLFIASMIRDPINHMQLSASVGYSLVAIYFVTCMAIMVSIGRRNMACPQCKHPHTEPVTTPAGQLLIREREKG